MRDVIAKLELEYGIDYNEFIEAYMDKLSREAIASELGTTEYKVRVFATSLGLRLTKKHREADYAILKEKIDGVELNNTTKELLRDLEIVSEKLSKYHKSLVLCRDENNSLRRELRFMYRKDEADNRIEKAINNYICDFEIPKYKFNKKETKDDYLLLAISDLHLGNFTEKEDVGDLNEFSISIAEKRLAKVFDEVYNKSANHLEIAILGDVIQGVIHDGNTTGEIPAVKAVVKFVKILSSLVLPLQENYKTIHITMTNSNHSRITEKPTTYKKGYDFDYIIFEFLQEIFKGTKIKIDYNVSGYNLIKLPNNKYGFAFHGDTIRNYDVSREATVLKVMELCKQIFNVETHLLISGHIHKYASTLLPNGGMAITVGTLMGMDNYAFTNGYLNTPPSQLLLSYNSEGEIEWQKVVKVDVTE